MADDKTSLESPVGYPPQPTVLDDPIPGSPADRAGLQSGDRVVAVNGMPVAVWDQLPDVVRNSNGAVVHFLVQRGAQQVPVDVTPEKTMDPTGQLAWLIGVSPLTTTVYEHEGFVEAIQDAGSTTVRTGATILAVLKGLFTGKVSVRDLAGPVGIARVSGQAAERGPLELLTLTAAISLNLGILNLLPIPILDGGHVLLLLIEGGMRRDLSLAFKERFVQVGLVFLLGIFAFVMYSDILKQIHRH
jgi:regulator of sigma E protease